MKISDLLIFPYGTLRGRLIISVAAVHAIMMSLFIFDLTNRQKNMLLENQEEQATAICQSLATSAAVWIVSNDLSGLQELIETQRQYPELIFAFLVDKEGNVLAHTDKSKIGLYVQDFPGNLKLTVFNKTERLVDIAVPAMLGNRHVGWARVGITQIKASQKLEAIILIGAVYAIFAIIIGSLIAWGMGLQITRRLYAVQDTISEIRSGNRTARSQLTGNDEAASIAGEFNSMLDILDERDKALLVSESKYRMLLQNIHTAVVVHAPDTSIIMSNTLAQELLGISKEQIIGKTTGDPHWHFVHEDGSPIPEKEYPVRQIIFSQKTIRNITVGIKRSDKADIIWTLVNGDPVLDGSGNIAEIIITFIEINELKQATEALKKSENELKEAQRLGQFGSWEWDAVTDKISWSEQYYHIYGFDPGQPPPGYDEHLKAYTPESAAKLDAAVKKNMETGESYEIDLEQIRNDGTKRWITARSETKYDSNGKIMGLRGTAQDITQRKWAENELLHLNRQLRTISSCNQTLMRSDNEQSLLNEICNIVCSEAGYRLVWVGYAENDEAKTIRPVARAGVDNGYLAAANITWADTERGHGPAGIAIRTGKSSCIQDFAVDANAAPWRNNALERGYSSCIALPLKDDKAFTFGVVIIYSAECNVFTKDEIALLEELSNDLAFGITTLRIRTEREIVEEELRKSELRYKQLLNSVTDYIYTVRVQNGSPVSTVHGAGCLAVTGYSPEDYASDPNLWQHMVFEQDREIVVEWSAKILLNEPITPLEHRIIHKDGSIRWVRNTAVLQFDKQTQLISYDGLIEDITERKLVEEELRESEKRVRKKLDAILSPEADIGALELSDIIDGERIQNLMNEFYRLTNIGVAIIDLKGKVLVATGWQDVCTKFHRVNPESCKLCIESDLELSSNIPDGTFKQYRCKNNMWDIATPIVLGDIHVGNIFLGQFLFDDEIPNYEVFLQQAHKFGFNEQEYLAALVRVPRWNHETINAVMSFYTSFAGIIGTLSYSNIKLANALEEQKKTEENLREKTEELDRYFSNALDLLCIADMDGSFRRLNPQWEATLGYKVEELVGRQFLDFVHPDDLEATHQAFEQLANKKEILNFTNRYCSKDGTYRWIEWRSVPLGNFIYAVARDISRRKRAEEEIFKLNQELEQRVIRRTAQLENANKELEAFSFSVSHDLRAPLRGIDGFSQILLDEYKSKLDERGQDYLERIRKGAQNMAQLIDDMLNLSRVTRSEINITKVDLSLLVNKITQNLCELEPDRHVEIIVQSRITVLGDEHLFRIMLQNLLNNAWKYTSKHNTAIIEFGKTEQNGKQVFFVRDDGAGFEMQYANKLFGAFQRLHSIKEFPGTGIGLAIVQRIIHRFGGDVWAESEVEKGATFYFTINEEDSHV